MESFHHHFAICQLADIFRINYESAKTLAYHQAQFALLAERKKTIVFSHYRTLTAGAQGAQGA